MIVLWLMCMFALDTTVTGKLDPTVSGSNYGLRRMSDSDTGCNGDPHGDSLKYLCDPWSGVTCCLYRENSFDLSLALSVKGGNDTFLRMLFSHLPKDNITTLVLSSHLQVGGSWCVFANLQRLDVDFQLLGPVQGLTCLPQLKVLTISSVDFSVTPNAFRGLNHLFALDIISDSSLSTEGVMQLQDVKELKYLSMWLIQNIVVLDFWPICLAQKHSGITIYLFQNHVTAFRNTIRPPPCNIDTPLQINVSIDLRYNAITHVSDIATGWGFSSIQHFIMALIRNDSTKFPIKLDDNPFRCDCIDLDLYRILRDPRYNKHLTNLANLKCKGPFKLRDRRFQTILDSELDCDSPPLPLILGVSIGGAVLLAVSLLGFLFYNRIRLYRWSGHKLHPWDRDECIGENKEFDVFVSHASEDEEWALELIEELECRWFKVLFHKRDFELGVTKIENIMMAVD